MNRYSRFDVLFSRNIKSTAEEDIALFFSNPLWTELDDFIKKSCGARPEISYNLYATQRLWNVGYHISGSAVCTLYPEKHCFIAMIVIGEREEQAVEKLLPDLSDYVRKLFRETRINPLGRWLLIPVSDKRTLQDVETLVQVRIKICSGETAE